MIVNGQINDVLWPDSREGVMKAGRRAGLERAAIEAAAVLDSVTGPTGGWIASPREVRQAIAREISSAIAELER